MTMTSTVFRMGAALKEELCQLMSDLRLDMSTYFVMSVKWAVRKQGIPFKITMDVPSMETIKIVQDTCDGTGLSKGFSSASALMEKPDTDD